MRQEVAQAVGGAEYAIAKVQSSRESNCRQGQGELLGWTPINSALSEPPTYSALSEPST